MDNTIFAPDESTYRLSRLGYYADFFTVPFATMIAVVWMVSLHGFRPDVFASSILAGLALWTFVEYVTHRWIFHGTHNNEHRLHHRFEVAFIGA